MKKQLLALFVFISLLGAQSASAQLAAGKICPDFTGTDINGTTWNLYSLLDSGKTVFIDVSATWCGPCWSYHNTGSLENLYNTYGPPGTDEVRVFFIEGEDQNTTAQLYGPANLSGSAATQTQGDWVTGTPYPIIDDASLATLLQISYFPTVYMICPDRVIREVGQLSTTNLIAAKNSECFSAVDVNDAGVTNSMRDLNGTLASCNTVDLIYRLCNYGTAPLTSVNVDLEINGTVANTYNWTGNLNTYESTVLTFTGVNAPAGNNNVIVRTNTPNGSADAVAANDSRNYSIIRYSPVGNTWTAQQAFTSTTFPPVGGWLQITSPTASGPFLSRSAATNGGTAGSCKADFYNATSGDIDALQLPQLDLSTIPAPVMTFDVSHSRYNTTNDNLKVKLSTNCGATWITLYNKSGTALATTTPQTASFTPSTAAQWRKDTVNLANYATNPNVFIKFEFTSNYGNNAYIDNVNISANTITGIATPALGVDFEVYPNPATDRSSVDFTLDTKEDIVLDVVNNLGASVYSRTESGLGAGDYTFEIPTSGLSTGLYTVIVRTSQGASTRKLVVK